MSKPENNGVTPVAGRAPCCPMTRTLALVLSPPFPSTIALHGLVLCSWQTASMQSSPPACASREQGDLVQVLVYMVGEQSGRGLASTNFNTRLNGKQKKARVSSVGDLVKKGGPTTS